MSVILNLASTTLNRDVTKVNQELYSSSTGTKVDATLDSTAAFSFGVGIGSLGVGVYKEVTGEK